jgi:hypothetical protein
MLAIAILFILVGISGIVYAISSEGRRGLSFYAICLTSVLIAFHTLHGKEWEMNSVWTLFAAGTLYFWLLTTAFALGSLGLVYVKKGVAFLVALVVYFVALEFFGGFDILAKIVSHWYWSVGVLGVFLMVSCWWFIQRWYWLTLKHRGRYNAKLHDWLAKRSLESLPIPTNDNLEESIKIRGEWEIFFKEHRRDDQGEIEYRPAYSRHKDEILTWMSAWPIDMPIWFVTELLHDFWLMLFYRAQGVLKAIMERNWRGTEQDMLSDEEKKQYQQMVDKND